MEFSKLGLPDSLCRALTGMNIITPTPVQEKAVPLALAGRDLIASARTGTGKTLAFSLPLVTRLSLDPGSSALVLVPTRELALQVHSVLQPLLKAIKAPTPCVLIGGVAFGPQTSALRGNPRVIIATPGRLLDHLQNAKLKLNTVKTLVLDEADRMLDMGFLPQVRSVLKFVPQDRQTLLFSATLPSDLRKAIKDLLRNPEDIFVDPPSTTSTQVEQRMQEVTMADKNNALLEAVSIPAESILVFARTKRRTDKIAQFLKDYGVKTDRIHGDRSQAQRQNAIAAFRSGRVKVLVATDIAARGLDIPLVELVINFDLPEQQEDYVHRIGRTGRAGATGEALSFVTPDERGHWAMISGTGKSTGRKAPGRSRPSGGQGRSQAARPSGGRRTFGGRKPQGRPTGKSSRY